MPVTRRSYYLVSTAAKVTVQRLPYGLPAVVEAIVEDGVLDVLSNKSRGEEVESSAPISATKRFGINSRGAKMNEVCERSDR